MDIEQQLELDNLAEELEKDVLDDIGRKVWDGYDIDLRSRSEWEDRNEDYIKLASQVMENKNFPWPKASSVKYPLLSISCLQFASRAYSQLFPSQNIVKAKVIGYDRDGMKRDAGGRISKHMSYQLTEEMEDWPEEMDRALLVLPICGNFFKKTYRGYDKNVSCVVLPNDLVVNYYASSLEKASRKSHILWFYPREIEEKFRTEDWVEPERPFGEALPEEDNKSKSDVQGIEPPQGDPDAPHKFIEQHTFYDLDDDGYAEPMIITFHEETKQVVKIVRGYELEDVEWIDDKVARITHTDYFTNFIFIPDVTSGVYGQGFGNLLGPLNKIANSIFNRLLDAGTLANMPIGFLSRGVRTSKGNKPFQPGEFRQLESVPGGDINKAVYTIPFKEPSRVLFELLGLTLESGMQLSSVSKTMMGENPGQNQPYKTTSDLLQQGQMVFNSIYQRIHKSLKKEFKKLFSLNKKHVGEEEYFELLDSGEEQGKVNRTDYQNDFNVVPASNPKVVTNQEELQKTLEIMGYVQLGTVNPVVATRRRLEALGEENIAELMTMPPPQPNPELLMKQKELQIKEQEVMGQQQIDQFKTQYQAMRDQAAVAKVGYENEIEKARLELDRFKAEHQAIKDSMGHEFKEWKAKVDAQLKQREIDKKADNEHKE